MLSRITALNNNVNICNLHKCTNFNDHLGGGGNMAAATTIIINAGSSDFV